MGPRYDRGFTHNPTRETALVRHVGFGGTPSRRASIISPRQLCRVVPIGDELGIGRVRWSQQSWTPLLWEKSQVARILRPHQGRRRRRRSRRDSVKREREAESERKNGLQGYILVGVRRIPPPSQRFLTFPANVREL